MNKYDEIEKLQKLKNSGSLTQEEFELEKNRMLNDNNKKKSHTGLIIVIVIVVVIGGLCLLADSMWSSSGNHGKSVVQQQSSSDINNTNNFEDYEEKIIAKWKATLPLNNTNGLQEAMYNSDTQILYLRYNFGICIVDNYNQVNRFVEGDLSYMVGDTLIEDSKDDEQANTIYMTAEQFKKIVEDVK